MTIGKEYEGETVVEYLARVYAHSTRDEWGERVGLGEVTLDGVVAAGEECLRAGQVLVWNRPPWEEPEAPRDFTVLWEDEAILAVSKPSGLPTLPGGGFMDNTLLRLVRARCAEASPVHRLGRGTSGIVLFAKTAKVAAQLSAQWNTRGVEKIYRAVAQGVAAEEEYDIHTPIGPVPHVRMGTVWAAAESGKASRSVARVVEKGVERTAFLVELHTGRPHQIRIHLASIGHPLVGDPLYGVGGVPLEGLPGLPGDGGYWLHAETLRLEHPVSGQRLELTARLPEGFGVVG